MHFTRLCGLLKAKTMYFSMLSGFDNAKTMHFTRLCRLLKAKTMYFPMFLGFDKAKTMYFIWFRGFCACNLHCFLALIMPKQEGFQLLRPLLCPLSARWCLLQPLATFWYQTVSPPSDSPPMTAIKNHPSAILAAESDSIKCWPLNQILAENQPSAINNLVNLGDL